MEAEVFASIIADIKQPDIAFKGGGLMVEMVGNRALWLREPQRIRPDNIRRSNAKKRMS